MPIPQRRMRMDEDLMDRICIDGGGWFDAEKATRFEEATRWDGSNHISVPTGSQWSHEELYRTAKGAWVLGSWSQWQGSGPAVYERVDEARAADWLVANGHDAAKLLPEQAEQAEL